MKRADALSLSLLFFLLVLFLCYYGIVLTLFSSIVIALILTLIVLQVLYPITQIIKDKADETLFVYAFLVVLALIVLLCYIWIRAMCDVRC